MTANPNLFAEGEEFKKVIITAPRIKGTVHIIHRLKEKGYGIISASNMTTSTYQSMVENHVLPKAFTKDFYFVATNPLNKKADGTFYEKPAPEYYQNLVAYINSKFPGVYKNIIFTDDKEVNVLGAQGIKGIYKSIHFINPEQFKQELIKSGVCLDPS